MSEPWPAMQRKDVDRVLKRAIELEHRGGEWIDGDQLRDIARQLDLDPRSVEQALREMGPAPAAEPSWTPAPGHARAPVRQRSPEEKLLKAGAACAIGGAALGFFLTLVRAALELAGVEAASGLLDYLSVLLLVGGMLIGLVLIALAFAVSFIDEHRGR